MHPSRRLRKLGRENKLRLPRWGYEKFEGFWPKKAREHPRGKVNFPLRMIPWLSPDAKHPGWWRSPQAQSSQVRFMRTLLVSPDFIADEIPATGGHRRFIRRARSTTAPSSSSAFLSATVETNSIPSVKQYPLNGSRGRSPLVRGYGGRTGPCFVSLGELKRPFLPKNHYTDSWRENQSHSK